MPSKDLVRLGQDRQVRSYHKAFAGEVTLYALGKDLRLWRPISARQIFWTVGLIVAAFVFASIAQIHLPLWSMGWFVYYFIAPGLLGWLFARALIEGRQLHVVLTSWARQSVRGRNLAGGYRKIGRPTPLRKTKIKVEPSFQTRAPAPVWYMAVIAAILFILAAVGLSMPLGSSPSPKPIHRLVAKPVASVVPPVTTSHLLVSVPGERTVRHAAARRDLSPRRRAAAHHRRRVVHKTAKVRKTTPAPAVATTTAVSPPVYRTPTTNGTSVASVQRSPTPDAQPTHRPLNPKPDAVSKLKSYRPSK